MQKYKIILSVYRLYTEVGVHNSYEYNSNWKSMAKRIRVYFGEQIPALADLDDSQLQCRLRRPRADSVSSETETDRSRPTERVTSTEANQVRVHLSIILKSNCDKCMY